MQPEQEQLSRRGFLRLSGAGAVAVGTKAISPSQLFAEENPVQLTDRTAPENPVHLSSSEMEVVLDRSDGSRQASDRHARRSRTETSQPRTDWHPGRTGGRSSAGQQHSQTH